jgi:hypothetical protein
VSGIVTDIITGIYIYIIDDRTAAQATCHSNLINSL